MCPQCEDLAKKTNFQESDAHLNLMFQLGGLVAIDIVVDIFECTMCRERFRLIASSCNGAGAMWELDVKSGYRQFQ